MIIHHPITSSCLIASVATLGLLNVFIVALHSSQKTSSVTEGSGAFFLDAFMLFIYLALESRAPFLFFHERILSSWHEV